MKQQGENSEIELSELEVRDLPDTEFEPLVIKILNELRERADDLSEDFNRETVNITRAQKP